MTLDEIRKYFSAARSIVQSGDEEKTEVAVACLTAISQHIKNIYAGATKVFEQAKCKAQFETFDWIIEIIKEKGLSDKRVLAFFGLNAETQRGYAFGSSNWKVGRGEENNSSPNNENPDPADDYVDDYDVKNAEGERAGLSKGSSSAENTPSGDEKPYDASSPICEKGFDDAKKANAEAPSQIEKELGNSDGEAVESASTDEESPLETSDNKTLPTTANEGDADIAHYDPQSLREFIGQQHIVKVLLKEIAIAKKEGRKHLDNILLFGNPGLGKTTLMELIAKELGVRFELLDCSQFRNSQQSLKALQNFFLRIARENEPVVIALDEIHMLTNELQSSLLTLLNNRVYISPLDVSGQSARIPIDEFTFIAATTDDQDVLETIKNRCLRLKFQMVDYTPDELRQIYKNKVAAKGLTITDDAIDACIPRSRGAMRYVNSIVDGLDRELYSDEGERVSTHIDLDLTLKYFKGKDIDPMGLESKDLEILKVLEDTNDAMGAEVLSARVGLDVKKYLSEYERYLIKIGFIGVAGKGRYLTEKARKYLKHFEDEQPKSAGGEPEIVTDIAPQTDEEIAAVEENGNEEVAVDDTKAEDVGEGSSESKNEDIAIDENATAKKNPTGDGDPSDQGGPKDVIDEFFGG